MFPGAVTLGGPFLIYPPHYIGLNANFNYVSYSIRLLIYFLFLLLVSVSAEKSRRWTLNFHGGR
jgi:hypothetical protein